MDGLRKRGDGGELSDDPESGENHVFLLKRGEDLEEFGQHGIDESGLVEQHFLDQRENAHAAVAVQIVEKQQNHGIRHCGESHRERVDALNQQLAIFAAQLVGIARRAHHFALQEVHHLRDAPIAHQQRAQLQQRASDLGGRRAKQRQQLHDRVLQQTAVVSNDHGEPVQNHDLHVVVRLRGQQGEQRVRSRFHSGRSAGERHQGRGGLESHGGRIGVEHALERLDESALLRRFLHADLADQLQSDELEAIAEVADLQSQTRGKATSSQLFSRNSIARDCLQSMRNAKALRRVERSVSLPRSS